MTHTDLRYPMSATEKFMVGIGCLVFFVVLSISAAATFMDHSDPRDVRIAADSVEIERLNEALDSVSAELRVFERYVRPDSALLHGAMIVAGVRNSDAEDYTRWMIVYGMQTGISPRVLLAVTQVESAFKPRAVSRANAHGLMQIVPYWWWNVYKDECGTWNPYDARFSICYGAHVLRHYVDQFEGDLQLALAAYNAGPSRRRYGRRYAELVTEVYQGL